MIRFKDLPHSEQVKYEDFDEVKAKFYGAELMANGISLPKPPTLLSRSDATPPVEEPTKPRRFYRLTVTHSNGSCYMLPVFTNRMIEPHLDDTVFALPYSWSNVEDGEPEPCKLSLTPCDFYPPKSAEAQAFDDQMAEIARANKALMKQYSDAVTAANRVLGDLQEHWISAMVRLNEDIQIRAAYKTYMELCKDEAAARRVLEERHSTDAINRALEGL